MPAHPHHGHQPTDHRHPQHQHLPHQHGGDEPEQPQDATEFWEEFYGSGRRPWSGRPNALLVEELTDRPVPPAATLDLGCGSGADAVWFARQGWTVTGIDIAAAALAVAEEAAREAGVADRITWQQRDLEREFPVGSWDLVVASYLHSPVVFARESVLQRAARAVAPGGTLLILGHQGFPAWHQGPQAVLPTTAEVLDSLDLTGWSVVRAETVGFAMSSPEGEPGERTDHVIRLHRG